MSNSSQTKTPSATMLLSSHCAHCPGVLDSLSQMIKDGDIGELKIINLEQNPEAMNTYKVRSVPWVKIGKHELTGAQTLEALQQRAAWAKKELNDSDAENTSAEFDYLLSEGQADKVIEIIKTDHSKIEAIMALLGDSGTVLSTRIGIGVVFEEFAGSDLLKSLIAKLGKLTKHSDQRIRADAYHYLGLTQDQSAIPYLKNHTDENDAEILEIIADSLEELQSIS